MLLTIDCPSYPDQESGERKQATLASNWGSSGSADFQGFFESLGSWASMPQEKLETKMEKLESMKER